MNLSELSEKLRKLGWENYNLVQKLQDHSGVQKQIVELYNNHFLECLKNEGLNEETAKLVASISYEEGHPAGYGEIVNVSFGFVEFAKNIIKANTPGRAEG